MHVVLAALVALAHDCKPLRFQTSRPSAAITLFTILPHQGDAEDRTGPEDIGMAKDGTVWFMLPYRSELGNLRNGKGVRCAFPSREAMYRAFARTTGRALVNLVPVPSSGPPIPEKLLPKALVPYSEAVAPNGLTWFTLSEGKDGNPTNAPTFGSMDRAKRIHLYDVPSGQFVDIAIDKNGILWLADYYADHVIRVDPTKL